jgi:hypothetical protein
MRGLAVLGHPSLSTTPVWAHGSQQIAADISEDIAGTYEPFPFSTKGVT